MPVYYRHNVFFFLFAFEQALFLLQTRASRVRSEAQKRPSAKMPSFNMLPVDIFAYVWFKFSSNGYVEVIFRRHVIIAIEVRTNAAHALFFRLYSLHSLDIGSSNNFLLASRAGKNCSTMSAASVPAEQ